MVSRGARLPRMTNDDRFTLDTDLLRLVHQDIPHLRAAWLEGAIDDASLRRDSATLRQLFVGDEQLVARAWSSLIRSGPFTVEASNLEPTGPGRADAIEIATIGETREPGMTMHALRVSRRIESEDAPKPYATTEPTQMRLQKYVRGYSMISNGIFVRRHEIIQYVAYRLGGIHFGKKKWKPSYDALEQLRPYGIAGRDAVFSQFLAIGQALVGGPSAVRLLQSIDDALPGASPHPA